MSGNPSVSIIIPVYNVRQFLREAVDSALAQDYGNFEVIAVNDGSTDGSRDILEEYSSRIRIVDKPNGGLASARNSGLDASQAEYVYFLDSDDWIEPNTVSKCVGACERGGLDFAFFDGETFGAYSWCDYLRAEAHSGVSDGPSMLLSMVDDETYRSTVCMSLFRRSFLDENGIRFHSGIIHEDELFSAAAYFRAKAIEGIPSVFYHRRMRGDSIMTTSFSKKNVDGYMTVISEMRGFALPTPVCKKAMRRLTSYIFLALMHNSWNLPLGIRSRIAFAILFRYPYSFRLKPFMALLFKKYIPGK